MAITLRRITLPASGRTVTYELERKAVKNLNLRIRGDGTVHLSIPTRTTVAAAEAFLREREEWLLSAMARVQRRAEARPEANPMGDTLPYLGGTLPVRWMAGTPARVEPIRNGALTVYLPDPADPLMREAAVKVFEKAETTRLVESLVRKYHPFVASRGVPYPAHIRVKDVSSRFGSCATATASLNFAARLCRYPLPFVEYVVVHELCHFLQPNHSDAFWREVARILPDWQARERLGKG